MNVRQAFGALILGTVWLAAAEPAPAAAVTLNGITFSDELGGFEIIGGSGTGSRRDPFVVVERISDNRPTVLTIRGLATRLADPGHGLNFAGFALIKVVINATAEEWGSYGLALESELGVPSSYLDGLSFGQAFPHERTIVSDVFVDSVVVDEPQDSVVFDNGSVPLGGRASFTLIISDHSPQEVFFLRQWREQRVSALPPSTVQPSTGRVRMR